MKKSILLFAILASVFTACNQQKDVDYANPDVYGIWAVTTNNPNTSTEILDTLIFYISAENSKFISEDSLIIYHSKEAYTENSDLGYIKYKYEVIKDEKLILTYYNRLYETYTTREFQWRPDLSFIADTINHTTLKEEIKGLLGKYEWISTENLDSNSTRFAKHVIDTLENSIIEFKINDFLLLNGTINHNTQNNHNETGEYFRHVMEPYSITINKKGVGIIEDKILPLITNKINETDSIMWLLFPIYKDGEYSGYMNLAGGTKYVYSIENNKLILKEEYSNCIITFERIE